MATSRSEAEGDADAGPVVDLSVPGDATAEEAAAIAAAVRAHVRDRQVAAVAAVAASDDESTWTGRQWTVAARFEGVGYEGRRIPETVPNDEWTAASRLTGRHR